MDTNLSIGTVVLSIKGRDMGGYFMVYDIIDNEYVRLVDGKLRKIVSPKKKKLKHLKICDTKLSEIAEKIVNKEKITDKEIHLAIKDLKKETKIV